MFIVFEYPADSVRSKPGRVSVRADAVIEISENPPMSGHPTTCWLTLAGAKNGTKVCGSMEEVQARIESYITPK